MTIAVLLEKGHAADPGSRNGLWEGSGSGKARLIRMGIPLARATGSLKDVVGDEKTGRMA